MLSQDPDWVGLVGERARHFDSMAKWSHRTGDDLPPGAGTSPYQHPLSCADSSFGCELLNALSTSVRSALTDGQRIDPQGALATPRCVKMPHAIALPSPEPSTTRTGWPGHRIIDADHHSFPRDHRETVMLDDRTTLSERRMALGGAAAILMIGVVACSSSSSNNTPDASSNDAAASGDDSAASSGSTSGSSSGSSGSGSTSGAASARRPARAPAAPRGRRWIRGSTLRTPLVRVPARPPPARTTITAPRRTQTTAGS